MALIRRQYIPYQTFKNEHSLPMGQGLCQVGDHQLKGLGIGKACLLRGRGEAQG